MCAPPELELLTLRPNRIQVSPASIFRTGYYAQSHHIVNTKRKNLQVHKVRFAIEEFQVLSHDELFVTVVFFKMRFAAQEACSPALCETVPLFSFLWHQHLQSRGGEEWRVQSTCLPESLVIRIVLKTCIAKMLRLHHPPNISNSWEFKPQFQKIIYLDSHPDNLKLWLRRVNNSLRPLPLPKWWSLREKVVQRSRVSCKKF